ncbi:hypothetical protein HHI36_018165 [Cryptolaemus montrouzieri]|uniref:Uncharacterized protein n=1 Tax=Cryptolaemus montrouzieri TaxID=559131 RepID=A0ABD2NZ80_9CUCU
MSELPWSVLEMSKISEGNSNDDSKQTSHVDVFMMPPSNVNGEVTDKDSGDKDQVRPSNLPGSQLSAPAAEHDISLAKQKRNYQWTNRTLFLSQWNGNLP